jgi:hypothetical protein
VPSRRFRRAVDAALVIALLAAVAAAAVLFTRGDEDERVDVPPPPAATPTPPVATPTPSPPPPPPVATLDEPADGRSLAVGITEPNPSFVGTDREVPEPFGRWRDALGRLRPELYRLVVLWDGVQPQAGVPPDLALPNGGCMRDVQPCAAYGGVRDQLRALASRQREGGWQALVVISGTPDWAAADRDGCLLGAEGGSPAPRRDALPAYRQLIAAIVAAGLEEGADLRYFSPWNEPNHPYFIAPQRTACDAGAASRSTAPYAALAGAMAAELEAQPGDQRLVLGETAGILERSPRATSVAETIGALPRDLVCAAPVWSQHAYIGGTDPVAAVERALARRRCPRRHAIWITETGVGPAPEGFSVARGIRNERQGCRMLHRRLVDWHADPRVTLAVQYTLREDDRFPTGLVTTDLTRARAALAEWQAWGARDDPSAPPPAPACG